VKSHEDIPRFIQDFFTALGLQYRWVVTRGTIGKTIVSAEDLDNDNAKEQLWMAVHEHEHDLLEDTVYRRIQALWSDFSDAYSVFDENGPTQPFCAQKVWEALLNDFPLQHKLMQTVLLAREIGNLVSWNGASKRDINNLFKSLNVTRQSFSCMQQQFTIDDVFKAVIMATLKSSDTRVLCDVYDQLLDDLDDNKDLTFAHTQTVCARQFRRRKDKDRYDPSSPTVFGTPRGPKRTSPSKAEKYNKYKH
jgi:hypothetical protein